ncbi:hypothetical protein [Halocatena pleomorpha]|nr:hypothetical protein [Halocatena pleomorpha]
MASNGSDKTVKIKHRCSCGMTFESAEQLREHARDEHDAVV